MASAGPAEGELSREEVERRLAAYDVRKNPRLQPLAAGLYPHTRRCAVLVPLFFRPSSSSSSSSPPHPELHVLLTLRSASLSSHADTAAFPGGVQDPEDVDDTDTALREAKEEVGLSPGDVTVVAHLPPYFVSKNNSVFPVVGFIPHDFRPTPNEQEVARVFSVPLRSFVEQDRVTYGQFRFMGQTLQHPFLTHVVDEEPILVWGFTGMVCVALARAIFGPFRRMPFLVPSGEEGEEGAGGGLRGEGNGDDGADDDDNVFGDVEKVYHLLCSAARSLKGRL